MLGKVMQANLIESNDQLLNIQALPTGIYYLKIDSENNAVKIIKTIN